MMPETRRETTQYDTPGEREGDDTAKKNRQERGNVMNVGRHGLEQYFSDCTENK